MKYELLRLKLYGEYAIDKAQSVRLDYVYHHSFFNEWTYSNAGVPFLYSDNTTLSAKQLQSVNFLPRNTSTDSSSGVPAAVNADAAWRVYPISITTEEIQ